MSRKFFGQTIMFAVVLGLAFIANAQEDEFEPVDLPDNIAEKGARFTHHTSIAPTGTISLSLGNNVSNGIEPSFAHQYSRNVIREGRKCLRPKAKNFKKFLKMF